MTRRTPFSLNPPRERRCLSSLERETLLYRMLVALCNHEWNEIPRTMSRERTCSTQTYACHLCECISVPVRFGAGDSSRLVFGHRVVPEEKVAPHSLHRRIFLHLTCVLEIRVYCGPNKVGDLRSHAPLGGEVVDGDSALFHQLNTKIIEKQKTQKETPNWSRGSVEQSTLQRASDLPS